MPLSIRALAPLLLALAATPAGAVDLVETRLMSLDLARDIAQGAVDACREDGYQVSVVVVDRGASPQVVLRDVYASRFTTGIALRKANVVVLSGIDNREFLANRPDLTPILNHMEELLVLRGALPIRAAGTLLGAVGVSGAPGGDLDEACARAALDGVRERLEFAGF